MLVDEFSKVDNLDDLLRIVNKVNNINTIVPECQYFMNDKILLKNYLFSLISKQKNIIINPDNAQIDIKGFLKNNLLTKKDLFSLLYKNQNIDRNIGEIPYIFLENTKNKKECSKKIFDLFAKYSLILNYDYSKNDLVRLIVDCREKELERELSEIINLKTVVEFIGNGCNGNGFKISVYGHKCVKDFFYKAFYQRKSVKSHGDYKHGADVEIMYAYYAQQNGRKNQFVKFYMGRLATPFERDAFLLTDFIERNCNYVDSGNKLFLDYLTSEDKRVFNTINGKIVDFGGLAEYVPALKSKSLRRLVRIILLNINQKVDKECIKYAWELNSDNIEVIKRFAKKYEALYDEALKIIKKYIPIIPKKLINKLKNINEKDYNKIVEYKYIQTKDIITLDIRNLKRNIKTLNLSIKSSLNGSADLFGYIILDLFNDRQAVYFLDKDNNITQIRIEKLINNQYVTMLELFGEEIKHYQNSDISSLLLS